MDEEHKYDKLSNHSIKNYNEIDDKDTPKNNQLNSSTKANTLDSNRHDQVRGIVSNRNILNKNSDLIDSNYNSGNKELNNQKIINNRSIDDDINRNNNNKSVWESIDDYFSCNTCSSVCNEQ